MCILDEFLGEARADCHDTEDLKADCAFVDLLGTTDDRTESSVALKIKASQSHRLRNEDQLQFALPVITQHRSSISRC